MFLAIFGFFIRLYLVLMFSKQFLKEQRKIIFRINENKAIWMYFAIFSLFAPILIIFFDFDGQCSLVWLDECACIWTLWRWVMRIDDYNREKCKNRQERARKTQSEWERHNALKYILFLHLKRNGIKNEKGIEHYRRRPKNVRKCMQNKTKRIDNHLTPPKSTNNCGEIYLSFLLFFTLNDSRTF